MPVLAHPILVPAIRLDREDPAEERVALRRAAEPWVAGFILFGGRAEQVERLTVRLRETADRPIFISSDMERGAGQQVEGLTQLPEAGLVGRAGSPADAYALGDITARDARSVGIDVIFAPVVDVRSELDNPILGNRGFGFEPGRVGMLASAMSAGMRAGGALPVVKHFPGHGATREDSHDAVPVVRDGLSVLDDRDLEPFHHVIWRTRCPALMTAHVSYPGLDPTGSIASFSAPIVNLARSYKNPAAPGLLVFTDALLMAGATVDGGEADAGRRALRAGCDMLLYPEYPEQVAAEMLSGTGDLAVEAERAAEQLRVFLETRDATIAAVEEPFPFVIGAPKRIAARAVRLCTESQLVPDPDALLVIDDDDIPARGSALAERAAAEDVPIEIVRVPQGTAPVLAPLPLGTPTGTRRTLIVFSSVRAWKGASQVSEACRALVRDTLARLEAAGESAQVLWCTPRPEDWRHMHLPGTGLHLERALGDALFPEEPPITTAWGVGS